MTGQHFALIVAAICIVWLLPFTSKLGKLFAIYLYRKYFFHEDIYVTYRSGGTVTAKYLIRKNADGTITEKEISVSAWGNEKG